MPRTWSDSAQTCLERRILTKNGDTGEPIETPDQMMERVAHNIALGEEAIDAQKHWEKRFYDLMEKNLFWPNSPALVNAGRSLQQLAACFVLPVGDSIEDIFESVKLTAKIHQTGGGTGFSFSRLRPRGSRVRSTGNVASGPVSFMGVFDAATAAIKQGGVRRGANMGVLSIDHPDILEFIECKADNQSLTNFNISVAVTNEFMKHLEHDTPFMLRFKDTEVGTVSPISIWEKLAENAWISGDPGVLFMDRINEASPIKHLGRIEATNPCGEVPLLPYHTCNLGSINLAEMVTDGQVNWPKIMDTVYVATRFLDNIITMNDYPHYMIGSHTRCARKIGLGVMGWANMLVQLGIVYGSEESLALARKVMSTIQDAADATSTVLAMERGVFPAWEGSDYEGQNKKYRNATRTVIAPTGTLSILADCSSGIEPMFELHFTKNVMDTQVTHYDKYAFEFMKREQDEAKVKAVLRTAHEIPVAEHVSMQAAWQAHVDDSISKTINFPNSASRTDIQNAYWQAWEQGCKGITVFRDGCKGGQQVLQSGILNASDACPDCGAQMIHKEGCSECSVCGLSMCGA